MSSGGEGGGGRGVNLCRGSRKISHYVGLVNILIIRLCLRTLYSFVHCTLYSFVT